MTFKVDALEVWVLGCLIVAAIGTTVVPILYSFSPWRSRRLGQLFMMQAISFAVAMDVTVLFTFWHPENEYLYFWIDTIIFTGIAVSTTALAWIMWRIKRKGNSR